MQDASIVGLHHTSHHISPLCHSIVIPSKNNMESSSTYSHGSDSNLELLVDWNNDSQRGDDDLNAIPTKEASAPLKENDESIPNDYSDSEITECNGKENNDQAIHNPNSRIRTWGVVSSSSQDSKNSEKGRSDPDIKRDNKSCDNEFNSDDADDDADADSPLSIDDSSLDGEKKCLVEAPSSPVADESQTPQRPNLAQRGGILLKKFSQRTNDGQNAEINSRLLEASMESAEDDHDHNPDANQDDIDNSYLNEADETLTVREELNSSKGSEIIAQDPKISGLLEGFGGGDEKNPNEQSVGNKFSGVIKAFQTRRLRARGDIGEKALTEKDIEILKEDVEKDTKRMQAMGIAEDPMDAKSRILNWREKLRAVTSAAFVPEVFIDRLADPEDGEKGMGFYFNVPAQDDNDTEEGAAELDGNIMRQMRIHVEGDKSTFVEEVAESLDNDPDICQHDGQDIYQYFDEEPGGRYNIIRSGKSDDHSSSSSSRLVNENKNLIEKVHRLEEELRECIEEREIWKLKATKLQEDLIGKLMSMNTSSLADEISLEGNEVEQSNSSSSPSERDTEREKIVGN